METVQQHEWEDKGKERGWLFKCVKCKCVKIADTPPVLYTFGVGQSGYTEPPCIPRQIPVFSGGHHQ